MEYSKNYYLVQPKTPHSTAFLAYTRSKDQALREFLETQTFNKEKLDDGFIVYEVIEPVTFKVDYNLTIKNVR